MAVRIRLARHGKKGYPFYHIIVADKRSPRDGRFIEKIGTYNPNTNPATIDLNFDKALQWMNNGAQPSDTCRLILSYKGVLLKKHLLEGVKKGALTESTADERFNKWIEEQSSKIQAKKDKLVSDVINKKKASLENETKVKEAKEGDLAKKRMEAAAAKVAETAAATENAEATESEATAEGSEA